MFRNYREMVEDKSFAHWIAKEVGSPTCKKIGEGSYALVYQIELDGSPYVMKLTTDCSYTRTLRRIGNKNYPIFPKLYYLKKLPGRSSDTYLTVEELVAKPSKKTLSNLYRISEFTLGLGKTELFYAKTNIARSTLRPKRKIELINFIEKNLAPIAEILDDEGISWFDFKEDNMGIRGEQLVIIDIGCSRLERR